MAMAMGSSEKKTDASSKKWRKSALKKRREALANGPPLFSEIGRRAIDLLTKDYNYGQKFSLLFPTSTGMGFITANGMKMGQIFAMDISTQYRIGKTIVDDTCSNISSRLTYNVVPGTKASISFSVPDHKSGKGQTVKASCARLVNPVTGTEVAPMMKHRLSSSHKSFCIGSVHKVDSKTLIKTRFSSSGKVGVLCQTEWSPKSLVTVSAECDTKVITKAPTFGLSIALKPSLN